MRGGGRETGREDRGGEGKMGGERRRDEGKGGWKGEGEKKGKRGEWQGVAGPPFRKFLDPPLLSTGQGVAKFSEI